jgi:hypothetical protein
MARAPLRSGRVNRFHPKGGSVDKTQLHSAQTRQ